MLVAVAVMFFFGLVGTVYMSLRSSEVKVPNVVGMSRFDAEKALEHSGLNIRKRADRFNPKEKPDTVLDQSPRAGETVKSGQTIAVVVSRVQAREGEAAMNVNEGAANANNAANETKKNAENANENSENANNSNNANNAKKPKKKKSKNENANNDNAEGSGLLDDTRSNVNNANRNSANRNKANAANRNNSTPNANTSNANRPPPNANRLKDTNTNTPTGGANANHSNTNTTRVPLVLPPPVSPGVKP